MHPNDEGFGRRLIRALADPHGQSGETIVVRADTRERLARHLYLKQAKTDQWRQIFINAWNAVDLDRTPWLAEADELLAVITGKDN